MKRLTSLEDIPYSVEIRPSPGQTGASWDRTLILVAKTVGTDGFVRDEDHVVQFGELKVTKRTVTARWSWGTMVRPDEPDKVDNKRQLARPWDTREVIIPRNSNSEISRKRISIVCDRLAKILAPQHSWLFGHKEALQFCADVHNHVVVMDVMTT